jgi:hypothetical protein
MNIPAEDRARIEREISDDHRLRSAAWETVAPVLDPVDEKSRDAWVSARQAFFTDVGVIPSPEPARSRLAAMKDRYRGERCFVIGNGPSLNRTALHHLENEFTFGVNRICLMFERLS